MIVNVPPSRIASSVLSIHPGGILIKESAGRGEKIGSGGSKP